MQSNQSQIIPEYNLENSAFIQLNQQSLNELLTFIDFADDKLTIGFVSVNFADDINTLIEVIKNHPQCQEIQFVICNCADPNLRFLRDAILEELQKIEKNPEKKLVLIVIGLEKSIGLFGEYPAVLQDLNFVRDAFTNSVPHPILFFLQDDALKRLAKYAPDFWAWRKGVFYFQTAKSTRELAIEKTLNSERILGSLDLPEKQERIDLLERLLMEPATDKHNRITILRELGIAYRSIGEIKKAENFLLDALNLIDDDEKLANQKASVFYELAYTSTDLGKIEEAIALYQQSLQLFESIGNVQGKAATLHNLASIYADRGKIEEAITFFHRSLQLKETIGDVQGKAATLHNLASIYADRGKIDDAIALFQQSLEITEGIGDVQGKAATFHQLGRIYANTGKIEEAITLFQQSLEIDESIGNVQGKAGNLHELGRIYANTGKIEEAIALYQQSLEIKQSIGNVQDKAITLAMLGQLLAADKRYFVTALEYLQQSLEILQRLKSPDAETVKEIIKRVQQMANG
ncbi:tetratricopeptide repeat protein [Sphaerospermopsis aphanizomenoides BCCUSP55]|uniref:tetratricopeptide repeat protein n=1 Tax=Sphaerospermopsis aphanizomenoides TaxID=459663 RepID=UPI0019048103|nr:tetratricopeptide repeat protein [Sphaerospermopsis aphanizomenoides]MBK1990329.1 tetratricopeptide repeat protein [Sphaerospermopsis aphanizomenoides BCCUSP55]